MARKKTEPRPLTAEAQAAIERFDSAYVERDGFHHPRETEGYSVDLFRFLEADARLFLELSERLPARTFQRGRAIARELASKARRVANALARKTTSIRKPSAAWFILSAFDCGLLHRDLERERAARNPAIAMTGDEVRKTFERVRAEYPESNLTGWRRLTATRLGMSVGTIRRHTPQK